MSEKSEKPSRRSNPFEIIEHTADVGLRIFGKDLQELFIRAGEGFFSLITDAETIPEEPEERSLQLRAGNAEDLLMKWLRELLYRFETQGSVAKRIEFKDLSENELEAKIGWGRFDPKIHEQKVEVKAVTYHGYKLEKKSEGWTAEVIFDI